MSKLSAFLHPVSLNEEKEVVISKRFVDEKGNPVPFKIRTVSQEENDRLVKAATRKYKENGQTIERLDDLDYTRRLMVAATVEPDFSSKEMCDAYGVLDPLLVPGKMLIAGEYASLVREITIFNRFTNNLDDEVKN